MESESVVVGSPPGHLPSSLVQDCDDRSAFAFAMKYAQCSRRGSLARKWMLCLLLNSDMTANYSILQATNGSLDGQKVDRLCRTIGCFAFVTLNLAASCWGRGRRRRCRIESGALAGLGGGAGNLFQRRGWATNIIIITSLTCAPFASLIFIFHIRLRQRYPSRRHCIYLPAVFLRTLPPPRMTAPTSPSHCLA